MRMSLNMDYSKNASTYKMTDNRDESNKILINKKNNVASTNIKDRIKLDGDKKKEILIVEQNVNIIQEEPIIKRDSQIVIPLISSIKRESFQKEDSMGKMRGSILFNKNMPYKNAKEILIVNKKRNLSYVKNILTNKKNDKFKDKFNVSDNYNDDNFYNFHIEEKLIENYRKNEVPSSNLIYFKTYISSSRASLKMERIGIEKDTDKDKEKDKYKDKENTIDSNTKDMASTNYNNNFSSTNYKNNFAFSKTSSTWGSTATDFESPMFNKEEYYNKLREYSVQNFTLSNFSDPNKYKSTENKFPISSLSTEKFSTKEKHDCDVMSKIKVRQSHQVTINEKGFSDFNATNLQNKFIKERSDNLKEKDELDVNRFDYYKKDNLFKDHVISKYVNKIKDINFYSDHPKHRKIYIIKDGTIILNHKFIQGKLIDVPTKRYFYNLTTKKDRMQLFYKFLETCNSIFMCGSKFNSIYSKDNNPIFDLFDINENDRYLYVSDTSIMRGVKIIYNKDKLKSLQKYQILKNPDIIGGFMLKNIKKGTETKREEFGFIKKLKDKKRNALFLNIKPKDFEEEFKRFNKVPRQNKCVSLNKTFIEEVNSDNEEWTYLSDSEKNRITSREFLEINVHGYMDKYHLIIYFNEYMIESKKSKILGENEKKKKQIKKENEKEDIYERIDKYNINLKKKEKELNNYIKKKKKRHLKNDFQTNKKEEEDPLIKQTKLFMKKLLENMQIIKVEEKAEINETLFKDNSKNKFIKKNRSLFENIYFHLDKHVDKCYPNLFYFNIPRLLKLYTTFDRKELYEVFIQYKVLMKLCIAINKTVKLVNNGIDFKTFWKGVPQMCGEDADLAMKIFKVINYRKNSYLSLEEFLRGMSIIRCSNIANKIDMFFKIIDTDGNGLLSFDEVYDISLMSLKRTVRTENENSKEVIKELAEYFATLIFKLVDVDIDEEIPLPRVKEKIMDGGEEAEYLEMFCCADGFKKVELVKFQ